MRWQQVGVVAGLVLLGGIAAVLIGYRVEEPSKVGAPILGLGPLHLWHCSDHMVLASLGERPTVDHDGRPTPVPNPPGRNAAIVTLDRAGQSHRRVVGKGFVSSLSASANGSLCAVVLHETESGLQSKALFRESDSDAWASLVAPPDVFGCARSDSSNGYLWGATSVFRTQDGGVSWERFQVPTGIIRRALTKWRPILDGRGGLLIPIQLGSGADIGAIAWLADHGATIERAGWQWPGEEVDFIGALSPGVHIVELRSNSNRQSRLLTVDLGGASGESQLAIVNGTIGDISAKGRRIAMVVVATEPPNLFEGSWGRSLMVSSDSGRSWKRRSVTDERIDSICTSDAGIWAASSSTRQVYWIGD